MKLLLSVSWKYNSLVDSISLRDLVPQGRVRLTLTVYVEKGRYIV
jgi:hypothetical protein